MTGQALSEDIETVGGTQLVGTAYVPAAYTKQFTTNRGSFVATGATPVVVAAPAVDANKVIAISLAGNGTTSYQPYPTTVNVGVGFSAVSQDGDTNTYNFKVF